MKLDDIKGSLGDTFQRYWRPALAGAALGGTTAGYLSRNTGEPGETPGARRRRMLRNALAGALLGGTAGVAIPAGARMAAQPWASARPGTGGATDTALGFAGKHALPLAAGGAGGIAIAKSLGTNREKAFADLFQNFHRATGGKTEGLSTLDSLRAAMKADPKIIDQVHGVLSKNLEGTGHGGLRAAELMSEAGFHTKGLPDLKGVISRLTNPVGSDVGLEGSRALAGEAGGLIGKGISRIPGERGAVASELYRRLVRPTIGGRFSLPAKALALGGGVMLANTLQNKALGR